MDRPQEPHVRRRREVLEAVRDARFSQGVVCPRCEGSHVQRWGRFVGRRRYRCLCCGRTFSDLTGTPAAYLKKIEVLPAYARCLTESLSVRESAARLGIHPSTAFRWRHRLLDGLRRAPAPPLAGWIEVRSDWLLHSRKGERFTDRLPRRRSHRFRGIVCEGDRAVFTVACDRLGRVVSDVVTLPNVQAVGPEDIERLLAGRVDGRPILTSQTGRYGPCARLARLKSWPFYEAENGWPAHDRNASNYLFRFRRWLRRFRGVATRYLPNYLSWHERIDRSFRCGTELAVLRWPAGSGFP